MKNFKLLILIAAVTAMVLSCSTGKSKLISSTVQTGFGKVKGIINETGTVVSFLGIPYAAPPVGDLRWKAPQSPVAWEGIRDASKFCANCVQVNNRRLPWTDEYMIRGESGEDCLFLNIWTPASSPSDNLPVLVFIHGGGLREGSGSIDVYNGEELAKKGIVVVTLNYRVGALGFLAHPWLSAESEHNASGNYGFMDQIAALKWINSNIAAFGGDPAKVTISGQSAGSRSVHVLTASPLAKGLFRGAVTMSGASMARISGFISSDSALARGVRFAESKAAKSLEELRALPATELIEDFGASVDGYVLPESMVSIFEKGLQNDVPAIAGLTADEGSSREGYGRSTVKEFVESAKLKYPGKEKALLKLYPVTSDEEAGASSVLLSREEGRYETNEWAAFRAKTAVTPAYTYFFTRGIPWPEHPEFGAFHTGDIIYWFNNLKKLDRPWSKTDTIIAETASSYLINFVKNGDPNGEGLPVWPAFDPDRNEMLEIGSETKIINAVAQGKLDFFRVK